MLTQIDPDKVVDYFLVYGCLWISGSTLHMQIKKTLQYRLHSCENTRLDTPGDSLSHVKTCSNIVLEAHDNNAKEKILLNLVLILLEQNCTGKNLLQCCLNTHSTTLFGNFFFD